MFSFRWRSQLPPWAPRNSPTGSVLAELPQVPGVAGSSVQGIVPRRFAAISLRSAGSQTRTVSAWAGATSAVIAAGLGATTWLRSSLVTIISSKSPSSPSAPAIQFAFVILTRRASALVQARSQRKDFGVSPTLTTKDGAFMEPRGCKRWQEARQIAQPRKRRNHAKTVAAGCDRLPSGAHGKEGVDGSSPSEGLKSPAHRHLLLSLQARRGRAGRRG
jgi:hypothetical protein